MSSPSKGEWLKPGDVLQKLKAKKRALKARINQGIRKQALESSQLSCLKGSSQKRINPFRCSSDNDDTKRPRLESSMPEPSMDQTLFEILRSGVGDVRTAARARPTDTVPGPASTPAGSASFSGLLSAVTAGPAAQQAVPQAEEVAKGVPDLPADWGLKTKIRFFSKTEFPWTSRLKTLEEASALTSSVRCLATDQSGLDTSPNARLHRHALYWQHPWLPWLPLFPRLNRRPAGQRSLFVDKEMQDLLRTEWGESLRSLFQLLRSRQCPFFYVCAGSFCCLFRSAGVGGIADTHAIITPTSRGLRDLLKKDDVQFSLPLRPGPTRPPGSFESTASSEGATVDPAAATGSPSTGPPTPAGSGTGPSSGTSATASGEAEDGSEDDDEDAEHWLEKMGIQADAMPGMHSTRRKLQQETGVDGRPESTVLVQGGEVYALRNFLLNSRACVTASGPLAGVPPTLLAPVGFQGASLQPLKVRHGEVQQARQTLHSFELTGPLMPHAVADLIRLVRRSHSDFTVSLTGVRGGEALSRLPPPGTSGAPAVFGQQGLADCGLEAELVETLCEPPPPPAADGAGDGAAAGAVLREVTCQQGLFSW